MADRRYSPSGARKKKPKRDVGDILDDLRSSGAKNVQRGPDGYRERSIKIHGLICAKCGREFDHLSRHLLTVHHRDGDRNNNPPDGSNWENLCVYCHDDEHSRGLLGDVLSGK